MYDLIPTKKRNHNPRPKQSQKPTNITLTRKWKTKNNAIKKIIGNPNVPLLTREHTVVRAKLKHVRKHDKKNHEMNRVL